MNRFYIFLLILAALATACQQKKLIKEAPLTSRPSSVQLITSDIHLFWKIYDEEVPVFINSNIEKEYFKGGTSALSLFYRKEIHSAHILTDLLNSWTDQDYYDDIRANTQRIDDKRQKIIEVMQAFKQLYPKAVFPDIHFIIGALNTGGVVLPNGQLVIAAEMFSKNKNMDVSYLSPWLQTVLQKPDYLPVIIIHELVHVQQRQYALKNGFPVGGRTLLDRALLEGSADFITHLVLGRFLNDHLLSYANPIEEHLWQQFRRKMYYPNLSAWLYNGQTATKNPADLGYYIGFKITEAFYKKAENKQKAIQKIIQMKSGKTFLKKSGYAQSFSKSD